MGNWTVVIEGIGPHGNGVDADIEAMVEEFLKKLATAHAVGHVSVTTGGLSLVR